MKYHILLKTIALLLCAVFLLGAAGGACGILILTERDLYNRSFEEAYDEMVENWADGLAYNIGVRYASGALGGCNTQLLDQHFGTNGYYDIFDMSRVGYVVKDAQGEVVQQQSMDPGTTAEYTFTFPARGHYLRLVEEMTAEEWERLQNPSPEVTYEGDPQNVVLYDAVPGEGADVWNMSVTFMDGSGEGVGSDEPFARLSYDEEGWLTCRFHGGFDPVDHAVPATAAHIVFKNEYGNVLFEAKDENGVGEFYYDGGELMFRANLVELYAPQIEEEIAPEMGAWAIVERRTPIWWMREGEFQKSGTYYGADSEIAIYATKVIDGVLYACTTQFYLTDPNHPFSDWVAMEDITIESHAVGTGSGMPARCNGHTPIWALEDGECYDTGMYYQQGQEIGILVLGTFDSGEWGLTDLGWVRLEDIVLPADTARAAEHTEPSPEEPQPLQMITTDEVNARAMPHLNSEPLVLLPADTPVEVLRLETMEGTDWALTREGWIQAEFLVEAAEFAEATEVTDPTQTTEITESIEESTAPETTAPEIQFSLAPIDPSEESVNLEETREAPATAAEATEPSVAAYREDEETAPTIMPETAVERDLEYTRYYDNDADTSMMAGFVYEPIPEGYTVELQLAEGALRYQHEWVLLELMYQLRSQLPMILGVSAMLLILLTVYLCCAAGRKPGTTEVRAGGLNRMPIDLYCLLAGSGIAGAVALAVVGARYFSQSNVNIAAGFALSMAYFASLLAVGFFFAFVAQIKTPGGFWWRNSICGWCWRILCRCCRWLLNCGKKLGVLYDTKLESGIIRFFKGCWKMVLFFWGLFVKCCRWLYHSLMKCTTWLGNRLMRFFSMLPLTWQWLVTGFAMLLMVAMVFATNGEELLVLICVVGCIAIILYGAHAFGTLLEGVKRMNKGDLDEKVDDKLLIGSFKDFSDELNGLAGVAVVAAQKQLKSERMKTELITNVSHDIKTPLTSIINYVDLMQKPHSPEEQEQYLEVLDRQSQRLKKLIDDLMEMSKASTGNLSVDIGIVNAGEAINQALGEFADKMEKAELSPVFRQPEKTIEMLADGRLVWRVMSNLLSNAVKYALPGTRVYIDLARVEDKVIISMKNISREELNVQADELLERFVRGDISRNTEGSGLGLNIAQSLMELQKGQLQILVDGDLFKVTLIFPSV